MIKHRKWHSYFIFLVLTNFLFQFLVTLWRFQLWCDLQWSLLHLPTAQITFVQLTFASCLKKLLRCWQGIRNAAVAWKGEEEGMGKPSEKWSVREERSKGRSRGQVGRYNFCQIFASWVRLCKSDLLVGREIWEPISSVAWICTWAGCLFRNRHMQGIWVLPGLVCTPSTSPVSVNASSPHIRNKSGFTDSLTDS